MFLLLTHIPTEKGPKHTTTDPKAQGEETEGYRLEP